MKALTVAPNLVEQVRDAILGEVASGQLRPGERIIQEQVAKSLGVSRQPVQQALVLLRNVGVLCDAPGRGLTVAPLEPAQVKHMYDMRAVIEGLACRLAAEHNAERAAKLGPALIDAGRKAVTSGSVARMVAADMKFHEFIYGLSGNPLVASAMATHWTHTQRVMGEVLIKGETPRDIWNQHAAILDAVARGASARAEALARAHITQAADFMLARLRGEGKPARSSAVPSSDAVNAGAGAGRARSAAGRK